LNKQNKYIGKFRLAVWRRIERVRQPRPAFYPLCYATNVSQSASPTGTGNFGVKAFILDMTMPVKLPVC